MDGVTFFKQMLYVDVLNRTSGVLNNNKQPFFWYAEYFLGSMSGNITIYLWAFVICMVGVVYFSRLFTKEHYRKVLGYGCRVNDIVYRHTAKDTFVQGCNNVIVILQR